MRSTRAKIAPPSKAVEDCQAEGKYNIIIKT